MEETRWTGTGHVDRHNWPEPLSSETRWTGTANYHLFMVHQAPKLRIKLMF